MEVNSSTDMSSLFSLIFSQVTSNVPAVVGSLVQRSWAPQAAAVVGPGSGTRGRYTSMIDSLSHCSREVAAHFFFLFPSSTRKEFPQPQPGRHRR